MSTSDTTSKVGMGRPYRPRGEEPAVPALLRRVSRLQRSALDALERWPLLRLLVGREGFEPSKAMPTGLQPVPFGHSGTDPGCPSGPEVGEDPSRIVRGPRAAETGTPPGGRRPDGLRPG